MTTLHRLSRSELDLSQIASRLSLAFLRWGRQEPTHSPTPAEVAETALALCEAVETAGSIVAGEELEDQQGAEIIPVQRRRMLLGEQLRKNPNVAGYKALVTYASKHNETLQAIVSGTQKPEPDELEELREHFARLAALLADVNL